MTDPPVGSAAEEAARLFAAVEQWARARGGHGPGPEHLAPGAPECTVCPLCQGVSLLRQVQPETVEHLLDAAASVVAALRSAVAAPGATDDPARPPRVERIDVREG